MATSADPTPSPVDLTGELEVLGRITDSSNLAVARTRRRRCPAGTSSTSRSAASGPSGTSPTAPSPGARSRPTSSRELGGLGRRAPDGAARRPARAGARCSCWIGDPFEPVADDVVVDLVPEGRTPAGWRAVFDGETPGGSAVTRRALAAPTTCARSRSSTRCSTTPTARARTACATATGGCGPSTTA